jgi:hypothetical protein
MADLSISITAEKLGKSLENLGANIEAEMSAAVKNLAQAGYASMISQIQNTKMDPKHRQDFLKGLQFDEIGPDTYMISLEGDWANQLEDGFPAYDMKEVLLKSTKKVQVGSRAGQNWVREGQNGKYAAVPMDHKPYAAGTGDMAADIKKLNALNLQGQQQKLTKTFKDDFGKPIAGKVASVGAKNLPEGVNPNLAGVTKYQFVSDKGAVSSVYMTYRIISENSTGWKHPGFSGFRIFDKIEAEIQSELENIVNRLIP